MAAQLTGHNPFDVPDTADLLHEREASIPNWSENYWFVGWSPETECGIWLHAGRLVEDPDLFYGQTVAYLPGDELIVDRSFGRTDDNRGPTAGPLSIRCEEPHQRWRITYDGAGERITRSELATRLAGSGRHDLLKVDVTLTAVTPVIDFRAMGSGAQSWYGNYWIQLLEMRGTMEAGGTQYEVRGPVLRDHSLGPRTIEGLGGDIFVAGVFPSGLAFAALTSWDLDGETNLHRGFVYENGVVEVLDRFEVPFRFDDAIGKPSAFETRLFRPEGVETTLSGETLHGVTYSMADPSFTNINGLLPEDDAYILADCPARFVAPDGEAGYGLFERGQRLGEIGTTQRPDLGYGKQDRQPAGDQA